MSVHSPSAPSGAPDSRRAVRRALLNFSRSYALLATSLFFGLVDCATAADTAAPSAQPPPNAAGAAPASQPAETPSGAGTATELTVAQCDSEEMALAEQLGKDYPESDVVLLFVGKVHRGQGRSAEAEKYWQQAVALNPQRADPYVELGQLAKERGQFQQALEYWRKALQLQPEWLQVRIRIGEALLELGKPDEAVEELQRGLPGEPRFTPWHFLMGEGCFQQKLYKRARFHYQRAISLNPQHTTSYYGLATTCMRMGLKDQAKEHMAVFRELKAAETKALEEQEAALTEPQRMTQRLARRCAAAGKAYQANGNIARAEELFTRALHLQPKSTPPHRHLAELYQATNRIPEAVRQYELIAELQPRNPSPYLKAGQLHAQAHNFEPAEAAFRKVIELAPEHDSGYRSLAQLYLMANTKLPEARTLASTAVRLEPSADNYFHLGWACHAAGDTQRALQAMEQALQLAPNNETYKGVVEQLKGGG